MDISKLRFSLILLTSMIMLSGCGIVQIHDHPVRKNAIYNNAEYIEDTKRTLLAVAARQRKLGACGPKALASELPRIPYAHFGGLRGLNRLEDCSPGVLIRRNQPPVHAIEAIARATYPHTAMRLDGELESTELGYRMADGTQCGVEVQIHPDPLVQRVMYALREAESSQALDRFRLIHDTDRKLMFILSSVPIDCTVSETIDLRELIGPRRLAEGLERNRGVLPLAPKWLHAQMPDLFRSVQTAKNFAHRTGKWAVRAALRPADARG